MQDLLTVKEVADKLSVNVSTVRRWCQKGVLRAFPVGPKHLYRVHTADLEAFVREQKP